MPGHSEPDDLLVLIIGEKVAAAGYGTGNSKHTITRTKPAGIINFQPWDRPSTPYEQS